MEFENTAFLLRSQHEFRETNSELQEPANPVCESGDIGTGEQTTCNGSCILADIKYACQVPCQVG